MNNRPRISVIVPSFNPVRDHLTRVLEGLRHQDLPPEEWECILVDNASTNNVIAGIDHGWHPNFKIVREGRQGLTFARLKGYEESAAALIVLVDDDNVLDPAYLSTALSLFKKHAGLGVGGGRSIGSFETGNEEWLRGFYNLIAVRQEEHPEVITESLSGGYPSISPIGAGMVVSRVCFKHYYDYVCSGTNIALDRTGNNLSSGGDNEINIIALKAGFKIGYFPGLCLTHLISRSRIKVDYLKQLNYSSNKSWVKLLYAHQICPWKPVTKISVPLRKLKAYFVYKPWKSPANAINYSGACGMFDGLSELYQK